MVNPLIFSKNAQEIFKFHQYSPLLNVGLSPFDHNKNPPFTITLCDDHWSFGIMVAEKAAPTKNTKQGNKYALFHLYRDGFGGSHNLYRCVTKANSPFVFDDLKFSASIGDLDGIAFVAARKGSFWGIYKYFYGDNGSVTGARLVADFKYPSIAEATKALDGEKPKYDWEECDWINE